MLNKRHIKSPCWFPGVHTRQCALDHPFRQGSEKIIPRLFFLCLLIALPGQASTLLEQDLQAGILDPETALLYQACAIAAPQALPARYREVPARPSCGTPAITAAHCARDHLSATYQERLAKALARPVLDRWYRTPAGHFRIHYNLTGLRAIDPADEDGNGVPDYVDVAAAVLDSTWQLQIEILGYDPPPRDGSLGGGSEYDVYIIQLGDRKIYGYTTPEQSGQTAFSYIELDNDYTDAAYFQTHGLDALRVTIAHEFFHAIQFGYYRRSDGVWWQEASSTWMEEVAYPELNDYLQYVPSFLRRPDRALDSSSLTDYYIYGTSLFAHFLDQRFERDLIRSIWEELGRSRSAQLENFDRVLRRETSENLASAVSEFAVWNYFTGERYREGRFYHEGDRYLGVRTTPIHAQAKVAAQESGQVNHLGSTYIQLEPRLRPGGISLETTLPRGQWHQKLLLISRKEVEIRPVNRNPTRIPDWDQYDEIVLVLTATEQSGFGYEYTVSVEYDPELTGEPPPLAFLLEQNHPNPFKPDTQGFTSFRFDLNQPSPVTRLLIFSAAGELVRRFEFEPPAPRTCTRNWDGRNEGGELVGSGVYYYVLETDYARAVKTLALIRE